MADDGGAGKDPLREAREGRIGIDLEARRLRRRDAPGRENAQIARDLVLAGDRGDGVGVAVAPAEKASRQQRAQAIAGAADGDSFPAAAPPEPGGVDDPLAAIGKGPGGPRLNRIFDGLRPEQLVARQLDGSE